MKTIEYFLLRRGRFGWCCCLFENSCTLESNYHFCISVTKMSCFGLNVLNIFLKEKIPSHKADLKHALFWKKKKKSQLFSPLIIKPKCYVDRCVEKKEALMGVKCVFQPSILAEHVLAAALTVTTLPAASRSSAPSPPSPPLPPPRGAISP